MEDNALYPKLFNSDIVKVKVKATDFSNEMGNLKNVFAEYNTGDYSC